MLAMNTSMKFY